MRKIVEWIVDHPWAVIGIIAVITFGIMATY